MKIKVIENPNLEKETVVIMMTPDMFEKYQRKEEFKTKNIMEELKILYKELQERQKHLESEKKTKITEGRIAENLLTMLRVQQLLIPLVVQRSELYTCECKVCGKPFDNKEDYYQHYDTEHN